MNKYFYAGIFSALLASCTPKTIFIEYPMIIDESKLTYIQESNGNCYLNISQEDNTKLRIYDEGCDSIADSVAKASVEERFYYFHDRDDLNLESRQYLDSLLQTAVKQIENKSTEDKNKIRGYNEILF